MAIGTNSNPFRLQVVVSMICCQWFSPLAANADSFQIDDLMRGKSVYRGPLIPDVFPKHKQFGNSVLIPNSMPLPSTGTSIAALKKYDNDFLILMRKWQIPGAQIAISQNGKLLYSKAYGWSNIDKKQPVTVDSIFRIASVSKAVTAVCTLKLAEQHKLNLATKAMSILKYPDFAPGDRDYDERLDDITITNLLQCTGGWDRSRGDPMFAPMVRAGAEEFSRTLRPDADSALRSALRIPITYEPGSHYSYSNVEYGLLGQIIAKVTKTPYEKVVRDLVLQPLGIPNMQLGKTLQAFPNEVTYYPFPGQELNRSLFPNIRGMVPLCYSGDFALEAIPSDCGWLASAQDLSTFAAAVFGDGGKPPLLSPQLTELMTTRADVPEWKSKGVYFGMGWEVAPNKDPAKKIIFRQGSLPGSLAVVAHRGDGIVWSFVLNTRPRDSYACQMAITGFIWDVVKELLKPTKKTQ